MSEQQTSAVRVIEEPFKGIGAVSTLILRINPEDAQNLQTHCYFSRARPLIIANIKRLAAEMVAERFVQGTVTNVAILPDGRKLLLNGIRSHQADRVGANLGF